MQGLYDALGRVASAAHANGDDIDENTFPRDDSNERHGLDVFHNGTLLRFRAVTTEPRFSVDSPIMFAPRLRNQYTVEELAERADVAYDGLPPEEQEQIVETILQRDLREAAQYESEFEDAMRREGTDLKPDILRLGYGNEDLWNGVLIRDRLFPYDESFGVQDYRRTVNEIVRTRRTVQDLLPDVPPINGSAPQPEREAQEQTDGYGPAGFE